MHGWTAGTCGTGERQEAEIETRPHETVPDAPGSRAPTRRVLIADDNADAAESLAMLLTLLGYDIRTVGDGAAAVAAAEDFRPDVAVLDIGMPRMSGHDAARRIRGEHWGKTMTLIALTGWGQDEDRRRTAAAGFDLHLTKPVDPAALEVLLAEVCLRK